MEVNLTPLHIAAQKNTPLVELDSTSGKLALSGRSLPENAISFYEPVLSWLKDYSEHPHTNTTLDLKIDYFNTPSAKPILDMLRLMDKIQAKGSETKVNWHHHNEDSDMREVGLEYAEFIDTPVELITF